MTCLPSYRPARKWEIPFVDLRANHASISEDVNIVIQRVIDKSAFVGGDEVRFFEEEFARYCESSYCVGTASGTDALAILLRGYGIGPGDEVITTPFTFTATAEAIALCGARVVFADIDPTTHSLDPRQIGQHLSYRTRAIIPVHLYGRPAEMGELGEIAKRYDLKLVEDAAQAHGAFYRGNRAGSLGDAAAFSFYPGKNLGAYGDGGAVVTTDRELARFVRKYSDHGRTEKFIHEIVGTNSRLDGIQAAILRVKLRYLDLWNAQRRQVTKWYRERLADCANVRLPAESADGTAVYHLFVIEVENRDHVVESLRREGIEVGVHYPVPLHLQPAFRHLGYKAGAFPHAENAAGRVMSLPMFPELTETQVDRVCSVLRRVVGQMHSVKAA